MLLACLFVAAYLLGAVPFGVLITRAKGVDITKIGSGNIGATNVRRAIGLKGAILVFCLDLLKGLGPVLVARQIDSREWVWYLVGIAAIAGHCASPFLRFRGGKGVATSLGMVFGGSPIVAACGFIVFGIALSISGFVSLSSIVGVGTAVLVAAAFHDWVYVGIGSLLFLFVLYTHRTNIRRLREGTESRFSFKKDEESPEAVVVEVDLPVPSNEPDVDDAAVSQVDDLSTNRVGGEVELKILSDPGNEASAPPPTLEPSLQEEGERKHFGSGN